MTARRRTLFPLTAGLVCGVLCSAPAATHAAADAPRPAATFTNMPTPKLRSPVDTFRELLAMNPLERRQYLTNRPPEAQKRILAKLREYQSLKPDERELRLRATELQWYLLPLMNLAPTNRAARLALAPADQRKLLQDRLARWDSLPADVQQQMLDNEMAARYFAQPETATNGVLSKLSPERRVKLEAGLDRWRDLSEEQREKTLQRFNAFFELTPAEKEKALGTLSEAEQRQMDRTLQAYAKLPAAQREQCIRSFEKFTGMTLEERQLFLKNAERWNLMTRTERENWRKLVTLAPIRPPLPLRRPPIPAAAQQLPRAAVVTNNN